MDDAGMTAAGMTAGDLATWVGVGVTGALGIAALIVSIKANAKSNKANEIAQQANEKMDTANAIADRANALHEQAVSMMREANELSTQTHEQMRYQTEIVLDVRASLEYGHPYTPDLLPYIACTIDSKGLAAKIESVFALAKNGDRVTYMFPLDRPDIFAMKIHSFPLILPQGDTKTFHSGWPANRPEDIANYLSLSHVVVKYNGKTREVAIAKPQANA